MKKLVMISILALTTFTCFAQSKNVNTATATNSSSHLAISVVENNSTYRYTASFDKEHTLAVKNIVKKALGNPSDTNGRTTYWEQNKYSVELRKGKVMIEIEHKTTAKSTFLKIKDLAENISETLGASKTPTPPTR